jgi:hypothetical protein
MLLSSVVHFRLKIEESQQQFHHRHETPFLSYARIIDSLCEILKASVGELAEERRRLLSNTIGRAAVEIHAAAAGHRVVVIEAAALRSNAHDAL